MSEIQEKKWLFVSFYAGSIWRPASIRLKNQAKKFSRIQGINVYNDKDLEAILQNKSELLEFVKSNSRGYGYWIWKPLIILDMFRRFPDCAGVIYLDVGCELNYNVESELRLKQYIKDATAHEGLFFSIPFIEEDCTHPALITKLQAKDLRNTRQIMATTFLIKNGVIGNNLVQNWLNLMLEDDFKYLLGEAKEGMQVSNSEYPNYREHRHDQSILSLLVKETGMSVIRDEQELYPDWRVKGSKFPIWATRNRLRYSVLTSSRKLFCYRVARKIISTILMKRFYP